MEAQTITTEGVMTGMMLRVRIARSFTLRTKLACWLIGLAGRVLTVPCEIEMAGQPLPSGDGDTASLRGDDACGSR